MKKILGFLGVTLVMAVSFFNMSSVVGVNQNVNLASIIQNASAQSENCDDYDYDAQTTVTVTVPYKINGRNCWESTTTIHIECFGWGPNACTPMTLTLDPEYQC